MRDNISCEEVFEADANARAEFESVCEEERQAAIEAQDAEMVAKEEEDADGYHFGGGNFFGSGYEQKSGLSHLLHTIASNNSLQHLAQMLEQIAAEEKKLLRNEILTDRGIGSSSSSSSASSSSSGSGSEEEESSSELDEEEEEKAKMAQMDDFLADKVPSVTSGHSS